MLIVMIPEVDAAHTPKSVNAWTPVVTPRPMNVGARPRTASSQPDRATHWRIHTTNRLNTTLKPMPPPNTLLWKTYSPPERGREVASHAYDNAMGSSIRKANRIPSTRFDPWNAVGAHTNVHGKIRPMVR